MLVIRQLEGAWKVKHVAPASRCTHEARALLAECADVDLAHVPREQNADADSS